MPGYEFADLAENVASGSVRSVPHDVENEEAGIMTRLLRLIGVLILVVTLTATIVTSAASAPHGAPGPLAALQDDDGDDDDDDDGGGSGATTATLPNTGAGPIAVGDTTSTALLTLSGILALTAAGIAYAARRRPA